MNQIHATAPWQEDELAQDDRFASDAGPHLPGTVLAESTRLRIPSMPEWIVPTVEFLVDRAVACGACPQDRVAKVTLALHEALTNSVVHGNLELASNLKESADSAFAQALAYRAADPLLGGRTVDIHTEYDGEFFRWVLTDQGNGFDVAGTLARATSDDPETQLASGRGIVLMQALFDDVRYSLGGRRVVLTLICNAESRNKPRRQVQETVRVAPIRPDGSVDWDAAYHALSRNLSEGGIGLLQTRLATSPRVLIGLGWDGEVLYVPAEVRHCEPLGESLLQLGCQFQATEGQRSSSTTTSSATEMAGAIARLLECLDAPHLPPDERRANSRVVYTEQIGITGGSGPLVGFARNLSKGGISFLVHNALALETRTLSLPRRDAPPLQIRAQIVRCVPIMDGVFEVGARFDGLV